MLFSDYRVVIQVHGAGETNIMFMTPGAPARLALLARDGGGELLPSLNARHRVLVGAYCPRSARFYEAAGM